MNSTRSFFAFRILTCMSLFCSYCVAVTITDGQTSATVTLYDDAMKSICGVTCNELIYQKKWDLFSVVPPQVKEKVGTSRLFYVVLQNDSNSGRTTYSCNLVGDPTGDVSAFKCPSPGVSFLSRPPIASPRPRRHSVSSVVGICNL